MRRPACATLAFVGVLALGCGGSNAASDASAVAPRPIGEVAQADSATLAVGQRLFDVSCALCHGPAASGTQQGPPLVHVIYEPNHHSDASFQRAAAQGVRAHHWNFGDMPPVPGVTPDDVAKIVAYVRHLQRQAGIGT